jgi:tetratricopeptide (TPR) repeat protein
LRTDIMMKHHCAAFILVLMLLITATPTCHKSFNSTPETEESKDQKWMNLISNGDREFQKMYWAGWNNAIPLFENAVEIKQDEHMKEKLFFSYLLLAIREKEFDVRNEAILKKARRLLNETNSKNLDIYMDIAERIVMSPGLSENYQTQKFADISPEMLKENITFLKSKANTDYFYYFYLNYLSRYGRNPELKTAILERERFFSRFPESNLGISLGDIQYNPEKKLEKFPDFIELILLQAEQLYRSGKFAEAESKYQFILEINPKVPSACTGIGSIYFWLELYEEAQKNYEQALTITPYFSKAIFGIAMCQHFMGKFSLSNDTLSRLIENQPLYHGEAYYYKALNYFNLKNNIEVNINIDKAMSFIPDSTELNAFAGIFHYYLKNVKKAKSHFQQVFKHRIHLPDVYFYSGLIALKEKKQADNYFFSAARYYWEELKNQQMKLDRIGGLGLNEKLKNKLRSRRLQRIRDNSRDSLTKLDRILTGLKTTKNTFSRISGFYRKIEGLIKNLPLKESSRSL